MHCQPEGCFQWPREVLSEAGQRPVHLDQVPTIRLGPEGPGPSGAQCRAKAVSGHRWQQRSRGAWIFALGPCEPTYKPGPRPPPGSSRPAGAGLPASFLRLLYRRPAKQQHNGLGEPVCPALVTAKPAVISREARAGHTLISPATAPPSPTRLQHTASCRYSRAPSTWKGLTAA